MREVRIEINSRPIGDSISVVQKIRANEITHLNLLPSLMTGQKEQQEQTIRLSARISTPEPIKHRYRNHSEQERGEQDPEPEKKLMGTDHASNLLSAPTSWAGDAMIISMEKNVGSTVGTRDGRRDGTHIRYNAREGD